MPNWQYGYQIPDEKEDVTAKASLRETTPSPKASVELLREIKNKKIPEARRYLEKVVRKKRSVPFKRHNKKMGHRKDLEGWDSGRYPVKAAREALKLLDNLENNAEFKGLDPKRMKIVHAAAQKARKREKYIPRAFGRSNPDFEYYVHFEMVAEELQYA